MRNDRIGESRRGGGLMILIREGVKAIGYIPPARECYKDYEKERVWALVTGDNLKLAVGFAITYQNFKSLGEEKVYLRAFL